MLVVVYFLVSSSCLILECIEEGVSMHVDVWLLSEESLTVATESIQESIGYLLHLLLIEFLLFFLEVFYPIERYLPDRHVSG